MRPDAASVWLSSPRDRPGAMNHQRSPTSAGRSADHGTATHGVAAPGPAGECPVSSHRLNALILRVGVWPTTTLVTAVVAAVSASVTLAVDLLLGHPLLPDLVLASVLPMLLAPPVAYTMARLSMLHGEQLAWQRELERNQRIMETAEQLAHIGTLEWDIIADQQVWSDEAFRIVGWEPRSLVPTAQAFADTLHPDDKKRVLVAMNDAVWQGKPFDIECRVIRTDGSVRTVHARSELMHTADGRPWRITGIAHDITERVQAEQNLRQSEELYRNLVEGSIQGLFVHRDGKLLFANRALARLLGYSSVAELLAVGSPSHWSNPRERERLPEPQSADTAHEGPLEHHESKVKRKDGSELWVEDIAKPIWWEGEPATQVVYVDITERKRSQQLKDSFVSVVSHELKTPVTSLVGATNLLQGLGLEAVNREAAELVEISARNALRLRQLVDDILSIQQLNTGTFKMSPEPSDLRLLVSQAVEMNRLFARECGVALEIGTCDEGVVLVDPGRFQQVMTNLLSNSAKYTHEGDTVRVDAVRAGKAVRISVTDHGPGITEEFRAHIFDRFARAENTESRVMGGTGLGLSIAKAFVEHMGGTLGFESEPHRSTSFTIELPLLPEEASAG